MVAGCGWRQLLVSTVFAEAPPSPTTSSTVVSVELPVHLTPMATCDAYPNSPNMTTPTVSPVQNDLPPQSLVDNDSSSPPLDPCTSHGVTSSPSHTFTIAGFGKDPTAQIEPIGSPLDSPWAHADHMLASLPVQLFISCVQTMRHFDVRSTP
ncbi:hypothetical protein V6N11_043904 [Hibiscus sabdariffa]|uniref:Uncharacterized protein n=1 Tax=Hibiscus sabdariffa TaxID=183260 RepID=A0ABR2REC6_9ROSI